MLKDAPTRLRSKHLAPWARQALMIQVVSPGFGAIIARTLKAAMHLSERIRRTRPHERQGPLRVPKSKPAG